MSARGVCALGVWGPCSVCEGGLGRGTVGLSAAAHIVLQQAWLEGRGSIAGTHSYTCIGVISRVGADIALSAKVETQGDWGGDLVAPKEENVLPR